MSPVSEDPDGAPTLTIDTGVRATYGDVNIAYLTLSGLVVGSTPPRLKKLARRVEEHLRERAQASWPSPRMDKWERLGRAMGLSEIGDLPAPRALAETVIAGRTIPKINFLVDAANVTALRFEVPVGAFDLDRLEAPLRLRLCAEEETITPILSTEAVRCAPGEIVYADRSRIFSRYSRDADFSKITDETSRVLCVVDGAPGMAVEHLIEGARHLGEILADVANAEMEIDGPYVAVLARNEATPAPSKTS